MDLDFSAIPDGLLRFAQEIATGCAYQAPALFRSFGVALDAETRRRESGAPAASVPFEFTGWTITDAADGWTAALTHAITCEDAASHDAAAAADWTRLAAVFQAIRAGIESEFGSNELRAYRVQMVKARYAPGKESVC